MSNYEDRSTPETLTTEDAPLPPSASEPKKKGDRKEWYRLVGEYILLVLMIAAIIAGIVVLCVYRPTDWWILLVSPHAYAPMVLVLVTFFTAMCEIFPVYINSLNSNVGTSQVQFNVGTPAYNYQLMNYVLYHMRWPAQVFHGLTFVADGLLWMMYFHYLLINVAVWKYCFVFFLTLMQALTFSDNRVRLFVIAVHIAYFVLNGLLTKFAFTVTEEIFAGISWGILIGAVIRVFSHFPEPLPIGFFRMGNPYPIYDWMHNSKVKMIYATHPIRFFFVFILAILSELQAGLPTRLVGCAWIMITSKVFKNIWNGENTNLQKITNTAFYILKRGFYENQKEEDRPLPAVFEKNRFFRWQCTSPAKINFEHMIINDFYDEKIHDDRHAVFHAVYQGEHGDQIGFNKRQVEELKGIQEKAVTRLLDEQDRLNHAITLAKEKREKEGTVTVAGVEDDVFQPKAGDEDW